MLKQFLSIAFLLSASTFANGEVHEHFKAVKTLPVVNHGWFSHDNQNVLKDLFAEYQPTTVIEVGSWLGSSAIFMAKMLPAGAKLYTVDTWRGSIEHYKIPELKNMLPDLYQQFLSNCKHHGVDDKIIPYRAESLEAAEALNVIADLIYVDASHTEEDAYADIIAWYPHVRKGGVLCGDDWKWGTVQRAAVRAAEELGHKITNVGNFWYFDPKP